ncbi:MAG: thioredoxin-like domain-containing protein [Chitinophagaceae bacterium]
MYNRLLVIVGIFLLASCSQKDKTQTSGDYNIVGKIAGLPKGEMIVCRKMLVEDDVADTAFAATDGSFTFSGKINEPIITSIYLPNSVEQTQMTITFFLEPGSTTIDATANTLNKAVVKAGEANKDLQAITSISEKYYVQMKIIGDTLKKLYDAGKMEMLPNLEQQYMQLDQQQKNEINNFIKNNPKSLASAYYAYQLNAEANEYEKVLAVFNGLDKSVQSSIYAQKLKKIADALQATAIGSFAPEFTLNSVDDKPLSLASFKGKYVLLDFWASWCAPCRQENPNVVKAFNQFKNKNFTILGVSLDEDKLAWQNAIIKDALTWQHVSDLAGWRSKVAALYGVQSIPANFLLDPSGKIIAKDLRGEDLEKNLNTILK